MRVEKVPKWNRATKQFHKDTRTRDAHDRLRPLRTRWWEKRVAKFVQISKCCEIHDVDRHCELPSSLELSDGSSCKHFLKLRIQSNSIELILCLYYNLLLVCPLHLLDYSGNLQPITETKPVFRKWILNHKGGMKTSGLTCTRIKQLLVLHFSPKEQFLCFQAVWMPLKFSGDQP